MILHGSLELGSAPADEDDIAQAGQIDYTYQSHAECKRYKEQMEKMFNPLLAELSLNEDHIYFRVHTEPGHAEPRREVEVIFDDKDDTAIEVAFFIEAHAPLHWSDEHVYTLAEFQKWHTEN